jgi:hypothetical protein
MGTHIVKVGLLRQSAERMVIDDDGRRLAPLAHQAVPCSGLSVDEGDGVKFRRLDAAELLELDPQPLDHSFVFGPGDHPSVTQDGTHTESLAQEEAESERACYGVRIRIVVA